MKQPSLKSVEREVIMTREQAKEQLIKLGIEEPSAEQISSYLNTVNGEVAKEKTKNADLKDKASKVDELQAQLDAINEQNMSEIEKANSLLEKANSRIAELEMASKIKDLKSTVANKFKVTIEQAEQIVKEDGSLDYDLIGQIIAEKETTAAKAKEQELFNKTPNPQGAGGGEPDNTPDDVKNVEGISFAGVGEGANKAQDYYK